jgi:hypothetical protein
VERAGGGAVDDARGRGRRGRRGRGSGLDQSLPEGAGRSIVISLFNNVSTRFAPRQVLYVVGATMEHGCAVCGCECV